MQARPAVGATACIVCHRRKVKCDRNDRVPCSNCISLGYECRPHERKRKRYEDQHDSDTLPSARESTNRLPVSSKVPKEPNVTGVDLVEAAANTTCTSLDVGRTSEVPAPGFLGRSEYLGDGGTYDESVVENANDVLPHMTLSAEDLKVLEIRKAFDMPDRATTESLLATFFDRCHPWMPLVEPPESPGYRGKDKLPIILIQAIFMAASRIHSRMQSASESYYNRSKVLFFMGCEKDPMTLITTTLFLQWWNPSGPERVSIHSSSYWLHVGVGLAQQIGLHREPDPKKYTLLQRKLRRRIWWTLFARDCLLSAGQGRPRAINPDDCFVRPVNVSDFTHPSKRAHLFVAYVEVSSILGRITDWYLRGAKSVSEYRRIELDLQRWVEQLPETLQPADLSGRTRSYDFDLWQLYLPYFSALCIMYRTSRRAESLHLTALLASSCIVRIVEDFMARDELRCVNAMLAIYLLTAGLALLSSHDHPGLWPISKPDFEVVVRALDELSRTWHTARGSLRILRRAQELIRTRSMVGTLRLEAHEDHADFFEKFGQNFCSQWNFVLPTIKSKRLNGPANELIQNSTLTTGIDGPDSGTAVIDHISPNQPQVVNRNDFDFGGFDFSQSGLASLTPESADVSMGQYSDWFLHGWEQTYAGDFASFEIP